MVKYLGRKTVIYENPEDTFNEENKFDILDKIRELKSAKAKHSPQEMSKFRKEYPFYNSWKVDCIKFRLGKAFVSHLQSLEDQRMREDENIPLTKEDLRKVLPFKQFIEFLRDVRTRLEAHPTNSGYACILAGRANTFKTTMCEILAMSFGQYHVWPGTQFVREDILKYDSAARAAISTIIIEECKWISLTKKITLNDTLCNLKEQLSGTGLNVRLAKNKSSIEDLILKIERFFISFNPDELIDYQTMSDLINRKAEFKRRFYLYDMDSLQYANLYAKSNAKWKDDYRPIVAKLIRNPANWEVFMDLQEKEEKKNKEIHFIMDNIKEFESSESEEETPKKSNLYTLFGDEQFPENQQALPEVRWDNLVFE